MWNYVELSWKSTTCAGSTAPPIFAKACAVAEAKATPASPNRVKHQFWSNLVKFGQNPPIG
jgi:hypothetical protein